MDYRKKIDYPLITFPKGFTEEDRGYSECCVPLMVFADAGSTDSWKNDYTGVYVKLSSGSDIATITIKKNGVLVANLGIDVLFPNQNYMVGYEYDWKQILLAYGSGCYQIFINYTIAGISQSILFGTYDLKQFDLLLVQGTIRIATIFDEYSLEYEIDFTDSNFRDTFRCYGFFGNRKPKTEINQLIDKGLVSVKTTRENLWQYELNTDPLNFVHTSRLMDFYLLNEDSCLMSDYNAQNHSYQYLDFPVVLDEMDAEYYDQSRLAKVTAKFGDRTKRSKSQYNKK
jgi:hypothetical protein